MSAQAQTLADVKQNDRIIAAVTSIMTLLALLLLFLWIRFYTPNPPFPEVGGGGGGGIELSLGDAAVGMGNTNPELMSGNIIPTPQDDYMPDVLTDDNDPEAHEIPPKVNKPTVPKKAEPVVNKKALFQNKGGSQGDGNKPGNVGEPTGDPRALFKGGKGGQGDGTGGGTGGGDGTGDGKGKGDGIGDGSGGPKGNVKGPVIKGISRGSKYLPTAKYTSRAEGYVVVNIRVDENGKVISASQGKGTTVTESSLINLAISLAKQSTFHPKTGADDEIGTIRYQFTNRGN